MDKEKLMQLLSEAIDKDASIRIHFSQYHSDEESTPVTKVEAQELIGLFAEALGTINIEHKVGDPHADSFVIKEGDYRVCCSYIPSPEEKMDGKHKRIAQLEKELAELKKEEEVSA